VVSKIFKLTEAKDRIMAIRCGEKRGTELLILGHKFSVVKMKRTAVKYYANRQHCNKSSSLKNQLTM
jgi:hypothetical protein